MAEPYAPAAEEPAQRFGGHPAGIVVAALRPGGRVDGAVGG